MIQPGEPFAAAREIGLSIAASDLEWLERRAAHRREAPDETLWCEAGSHEWVLPRIPGRRPRSCPLHSNADNSGPRISWPGAQPDCFLIEGRWAVRIFVDAPLLRGATWRVPTTVADGLGIEAEKSLRPERNLNGSLVVRLRGNGCTGGGISDALQGLGVIEGDFVFVRLSPTSYDVIARRRREIASTDALGRLLWGCGIDPNEQDARSQPWLAVARAIGGGEADRDALRQRLAARHNFELVTALDETRGVKTAIESTQTDWPPGWEFTAALDENESRYALRNTNGMIRVAVASTDGDRDRNGLVVDRTGLAWREIASSRDAASDDAEHRSNERWVRWKRAEHNAVRAALAGVDWRLTRLDGTWYATTEDAYVDLAAALEAVPAPSAGRPRPPTTATRATSPRSGFAYDRLVRRAIDSGLNAIAANSTSGFVAVFDNGERTEAPTLADLLAPSS